jgi:hypothetical protein
VSTDDRHQKFLDDLKERQDRFKLGDFNESLDEVVKALNNLTHYLGVQPDELQSTIGAAPHHDYHQEVATSADHVGDLVLPAAVAAVVIMQNAIDALGKFTEWKDFLLDGQSLEETSAKIADVWQQFKASTEQVIEDVQQQMTELVSPEKTQEQDAPTAERAQETPVEIGGPQVEAEIAEITEMQERHEKERADQAAQVAEFEKNLAERYKESPEKEERLDDFKEAAAEAAELQAKQQALELQQLQERQLQDRDRER